MPSRSVAQQHYFGAILGGAIPKPKGMSTQTARDFASTSTKNLPQRVKPHLADGRKPMASNTLFQQSEPVRGKRPAWMDVGKPHMADGRKPIPAWMEHGRMTAQTQEADAKPDM